MSFETFLVLISWKDGITKVYRYVAKNAQNADSSHAKNISHCKNKSLSTKAQGDYIKTCGLLSWLLKKSKVMTKIASRIFLKAFVREYLDSALWKRSCFLEQFGARKNNSKLHKIQRLN